VKTVQCIGGRLDGHQVLVEDCVKAGHIVNFPVPKADVAQYAVELYEAPDIHNLPPPFTTVEYRMAKDGRLYPV
jgi:hypothetical protein